MKEKSSWRMACDWHDQIASYAHRPSETEDLGNGRHLPAPVSEPFDTDADQESEASWLGPLAAEAVLVHGLYLRRRAECEATDTDFDAVGMSRTVAEKSLAKLEACLEDLERQLLEVGIYVRRRKAAERRQLAARIDPRPRTLHGKTLSKGSA